VTSSGVVVALETSTRRPSVAACHVGSAPLVERLEGERAHASDLLPRLDALLARLGAGPRDIVRVVVGLGPGSLTGIRVGAAHALGVARAAGADLVGVPSFEAAAAAVEADRTVLLLADARGGQFDAALYHTTGSTPWVLRAPFSLEKMTYDDASGSVIYRSHMHKSLKRNFQVMPGAQWLELLCRHIPDRFEHLVRYVGWYSNRCRVARERAKREPLPEADPLEAELSCARAKASWARLIHKVYEVDPLICPVCKGPMHVIALIEDPEVIRRILTHLGRWAPRKEGRRERAPPVPSGGANLELTYHPVPDIA